MKKIVISFFAVGILAILISVFRGGVQPTNDREFGAAQLLGVEIGIGLILLGIGIAVTKLDDSASAWVLLHEAHDKIQRLPAVFWILFAFFLTYLTFFLFPVFLNSHHKIDYVAGYIRDQGRIGFDIRSIVERIENWFILGQSPYSDGFIAYPPLTIAVFAPLVLAGFPGYFYLVTTLTLFCFVVSTLAVPRLIFKQGQVFLIFLFFFTGLFSYGFQFELERGQFNAIAFSLCVIAVFLFHWKSEFNYWAYLLFTISVQLKVYPIFFIVMFVKDWRDWKNNLRRFLGLAALSFSILFVLGYQIFRDFLEPVCKIRKEENGSNSDHGREIYSSFFIACGNATELFEAIDETFNNVSLAIEGFFKRTSAAFVTATSNRTANMFSMKIRTKGLAGVAFISHQTFGTQTELA